MGYVPSVPYPGHGSARPPSHRSEAGQESRVAGEAGEAGEAARGSVIAEAQGLAQP